MFTYNKNTGRLLHQNDNFDSDKHQTFLNKFSLANKCVVRIKYYFLLLIIRGGAKNRISV